ncbi:hypothetical protein KL86CLO1_10544 [uncultured Eubacteriales bacterium]|uniref:Uncharacterized protein n=1 Tax=uncultured Eubacteriales bacterium TaxID=172733 RepID=A0A212J664_9FIRM|nr:hypothetical protein KL86CLO1_10544 [uncultured Eubacteriales bacterium]
MVVTFGEHQIIFLILLDLELTLSDSL